MKNIEQGHSNKVPPTSTHSNLVANKPIPGQNQDQKPLSSENIPRSCDVNCRKEKANSNPIGNKPSVSHPKVIDILDNQLEQL